MKKLLHKTRVRVGRLFMEFNWYKTMREFYSGVKYQNKSFYFINSCHLSKEKQQFLENHSIRKKEREHLIIYKLKNDARETVVLKLGDFELFRLDDVLMNELFEPGALKINSGFLRDELLKCVCPAEDRKYRYCESLLNFHLNNYTEQKDKSDMQQFFLGMYKYVISHIRGRSVLDVGSCGGVFPILLKLKMPYIEVTASDYNYEDFNEFALKYSKDKNIAAKFIKLDILAPPAGRKYDTVTAIHILEHFGEKDILSVIKNLLKLTDKRLIVVVPFEKLITIKEHRQRFDGEKLKRIVEILNLPYKIENTNSWNYAVVIDI